MTVEEGPETTDVASAARRAYSEIVERLATGELTPGTWLRERTLAADLQMSRTPVREALNKLSAEGLVRLERNRGAQVVSWSRDQVVEFYGLRAATEGYVAALAATKVDEDTLRLLDENQAAYEQAIAVEDGTRGRAAELNDEFHNLILRATGNESLTHLLSGLMALPLVRRTFLRYSDDDLRRSAAHHRELTEALRQGDAEAAEMIMKVHIRTAQRAMLRSERLDAD